VGAAVGSPGLGSRDDAVDRLFYSGSQLLPSFPIEGRRKVGQLLGGATIAYRTRRI
jgi:hypothetical protein